MRRLAVLTVLLSAACGSPAEPVVPTLAVVRALHFVREDPKGVSNGMNLDGFVSENNEDGRSCFKPDFVAPDGVPGIDNELARLLPLVDLAGENAVESLLQGSIDEGRLLMLVEITPHGDTADLRVLRGMDVPLLGTDGKILAGQTLGLDPDPILGELQDVPMVDGTLTADTFSLQLPVVVFSQLYQVVLPKAHMHFSMNPDGTIESGLIAGGIPVDDLVTIMNTAAEFGGDFDSIFGDALRSSGDLDRDADGNCTAMSAAVTFDAVQAFTFE